jgi:ketosteroid isomerase-like protein
VNWSPLETVRSYYNSLEPGNRQVLMEILDPQVILEIQEGFPGSRCRYVGLRAYMEDFLYSLYESFELEFYVEELLECGSRVTVVGRMRGKAVLTGVPVDVGFLHLWNVHGGRMTHARMYTDTAVLRDAVAGRAVPTNAA